ncbi:type II toxin-antitoxin system RelE/ParE family toxin [Thiohalophilus sp.]|uniref:type II toxin-antitoxin system RelE family toxin n=1 Tax=Thiohalophilus sp. TaxID=3028392 RepID=UPI002ACE0DDE|nr:type II toxin-antitoxin system RelE/ParE family toxin [Thiohalophilus sp.]MDZ7662781.1 type II toxin-antitoxin system RelE/ParE family toxin [Thiohalophilus sp.]
MTWRIKYARSVQKSVKKLNPRVRQRLRDYLENRIAQLADPRQIGKPLKGHHSELWRYRVGDYRIICEIQDNSLVVLVVRIGHRKEIYR